MNTVWTLVVVLQVISALAIIGLVLLQHGKGADMGAAFGSGASGSLFGASGSSNFLSKSTAVAAGVFFCATLGLALLGGRHTSTGPSGSVMENYKAAPPAAAPAQTTAPAPQQDAPATKTESAPNPANQIPK